MRNDERPYQKLGDLLDDYGYAANQLQEAQDQLEFVKSVLSQSSKIEKDLKGDVLNGRVYSIQAPWGMGKTSYLNILIDQIMSSANIDPQKLCYYYYDSLYYGSASEAIKTLMSELFSRVEQQFAISLRGAKDIAKNLTPSVEISTLFARLNLSSRYTDTNTIISEKLRNQLENLGGKVLVVIDDVDRLTGSEALHLLRLVRLLQGLPNTFIFLPLDYSALVKMLVKEGVSNPGGYVGKIITKPIRLNFSLNDPRIFFKRNFLDAFRPSDSDNSNNHILDLWMGYLWELSLQCLRNLEIEGVKIQMNTTFAPQIWEQAEALNSSEREVFVSKFFQATRKNYGAVDDYLIKFKVSNSNPAIYRYYRYSYIAPETSFDRFFNGQYSERYMVAQVGGGLEMTCGRDAFSLELYKEEHLTSTFSIERNSGEEAYYELDDDRAQQIDGNKITLWDLVLSVLLDIDLPQSILKYVSPRMIKRLIDELSRESGDIITHTLAGPREPNRNLYFSNKSLIAGFVQEYATD